MAKDIENVVNRLVRPQPFYGFWFMVLGLEFAVSLIREETKMAMKAMAFKNESMLPSANICQ